MFPNRYFTMRYFPTRYFCKVGAASVPLAILTMPTIVTLLTDGQNTITLASDGQNIVSINSI